MLCTCLVAEHLAEPDAMSQLLGLRAVVQRVVQQQRLPPLVRDEADDSQRRSDDNDHCQAPSEVSLAAGLPHNGRG